jgi:hypothetical protein
MSLLSAFKGVENNAVEAKLKGQNSLRLTIGHDVYEVRPASAGTALI